MRTHEIEVSLRRWFEEELQLPDKHADRVQVWWRGEPYTDNQLAMVLPRMRAFARTGPRDGDSEIMTLEVRVALKQEPGNLTFGLLSLLVDEVRRLVDSTRRDVPGNPAAVAKLHNQDNVPFAVLDFGPAQETRAEDQTIQVGGVTLTGIDLAVLTSEVLISPFKPRVARRTIRG